MLPPTSEGHDGPADQAEVSGQVSEQSWPPSPAFFAGYSQAAWGRADFQGSVCNLEICSWESDPWLSVWDSEPFECGYERKHLLYLEAGEAQLPGWVSS